MKATRTLIFLATFSAISLALTAQEKYTLTYRFEKGKEYRFKTEMSIESTQEMMGNEMKMDMNGTLNSWYRIESASPQGVIEAMYVPYETQVRVKGMGNDTTIRILPKDGHDTILVSIAPNGRTIHQQAADTTPGKSRTMLEGLSQKVKLFELPDHPVAIGDTWEITTTDTISKTGLMITITKTSCTLTGKEEIAGKTCLKVEYKGSAETSGKMLQMGMEMFMEGTSETSGTAWFDPGTGLMVKDDSSSDSDMTMAVTGQAQMTIPITQKIHTVTSLLE